MPSDQHCHDGGLTRASRQLQRHPQEFGIRGGVSCLQMRPEASTLGGRARRDFSQPDHRLHRLDLAEERALIGERVHAPVAQQPGGRRCDLPLAFRQRPPALDGRTDAVDYLGGVVFLARFVGEQVGLDGLPAHLLRLGDRRHEGTLPPSRHDEAGRLAVGVHFPVSVRFFIGGVQHWRLEESITHPLLSPRFLDRRRLMFGRAARRQAYPAL